MQRERGIAISCSVCQRNDDLVGAGVYVDEVIGQAITIQVSQRDCRTDEGDLAGEVAETWVEFANRFVRIAGQFR